MKVNTSIPQKLKPYFSKEIDAYRAAMRLGEWHRAWHHLERAHVIGQAYPWEHSYVHWLMLRFGIAIKSTREVVGQIPRLLVGGVKSFVGKIPVGNTGGANVPPLKPMPIAADIRAIFDQAGI